MKINQDILDEIKKRFNRVHEDSKAKSRKEWTGYFFDSLVDIGIENGLKIYTHSSNKKIPQNKGETIEWLFDLCWSNEGDKWIENYKGLKLICESEWNMNKEDVLYDFQKLAVGKAEIKIMIVQYDDKFPFDDIKTWCEDSVNKSLHMDGATYILIGSGNGKDDNEVKFEELWKTK